MSKNLKTVLCAALAAVFCISSPAFAQRYSQTNLVSDIPGLAAVTDPNLVNAWGVSYSPTSPFWVSDNGTGLSTLYNGNGAIVPLVVKIPPPHGSTAPSTPTGQVFNGSGDFVVSGGGNSGPAIFIFDTEDGTISGWNPGVDRNNAILVLDNSGMGAVYKGLASTTGAEGNFLYAANFHAGAVEVYNGSFQWVKNIVDVSLPPNYAPFGIQNIAGKIYITFAEQNESKSGDVPGPNHGFVDVYDPTTGKLSRLISHTALNSPWGIDWAPANFGAFSNDLLVGNFGDGLIHAFNPTTGALVGTLLNKGGSFLRIDGLWAVRFGNGTATAPKNVLFFTAGPDGETHGLFGNLQPAISSK